MTSRQRRFNPGRWQLERERCQLPGECPPVSSGGPAPIGDLAAELLNRVGLEHRVWEQTLIEEWHALVGDAIARRARPGHIQRGVLTIFVSNAAWMHELQRFGKDELLKKLQARFGAARIASIRFAADPDLPSAAPPRGRRSDAK